MRNYNTIYRQILNMIPRRQFDYESSKGAFTLLCNLTGGINFKSGHQNKIDTKNGCDVFWEEDRFSIGVEYPTISVVWSERTHHW